jgi:hypothetical protein
VHYLHNVNPMTAAILVAFVGLWLSLLGMFLVHRRARRFKALGRLRAMWLALTGVKFYYAD